MGIARTPRPSLLLANLDHLYDECKRNHDIRPGNSQLECTNGCANHARPEACKRFCDCIYNEGNPLDKCLEEYRKGKE